jgi:hypothetical protein
MLQPNLFSAQDKLKAGEESNVLAVKTAYATLIGQIPGPEIFLQDLNMSRLNDQIRERPVDSLRSPHEYHHRF